jgi:hypothetical protein
VLWSTKSARVSWQPLAAEEAVIVKYIQLAYQQGFPLTIASLRDMANEILLEKGSHAPIGVNWHLKFLKRHPELRSALSRPIDKQRIMSEDPDVFIYFFRVFEETVMRWARLLQIDLIASY